MVKKILVCDTLIVGNKSIVSGGLVGGLDELGTVTTDEFTANTATFSSILANTISTSNLTATNLQITGTPPYTSKIVSVSGLTATVGPFEIEGYQFGGGSISLIPNGTWYVGVDLFRTIVVTLPRLGHRGWIPVGKVVTNSVGATTVDQIVPVLPRSRLPRTINKMLSGQQIQVVIMGSSLTTGGTLTTDWPGMLFNSSSNFNDYRVPAVSCQFTGVAGSPNQYQLAQLGIASNHTGFGFRASGHPGLVTNKLPPNGRSLLFKGVDLVIIGCLANSVDYRLQGIEPLIRKLRAQGIEVIVVTDNPQDAASSSYAALTNARLYVDAPVIQQLCDLYGVEFADTAAYVTEATMRYGTSTIYTDTIHMTTGTPAGRTAAPSCGHEVWARAIRSVITVNGAIAPPFSGGPITFSSGVPSTISVYGDPANVQLQVVNGQLVATCVGDLTGFVLDLQDIVYPGDVVNVTFDYVAVTGTIRPSGLGVGMNTTTAAGWASNIVNFTTTGTGRTLSLTGTLATSKLLFFVGSSTTNGSITVDNISYTITHTTGIATDVTPRRRYEVTDVPPIRVVTDYKTPADAFVILPKDECFLSRNDPNKGTLGAHPWGSRSFSRRWGTTLTTDDLLTLGVGKRAALSGHGVVGMSLIHYKDQTETACTIEVRRNDALVKTMTIGTVPFANEWYYSVFTPSEYNQTQPFERGDGIEIKVTSGTLRIAALVCLTADIDYVNPDEIEYLGTWLPKETSRSNFPGYPTDTSGSYAQLRCTGRRLQWLISGNPGSKTVRQFSGRETNADLNYGGNLNVYGTDGCFGPNENHYIVCIESNPQGTQADGHALHVGGALIINDR